ncbi:MULTISPECIES: hypothetical protein [unclassified Leifsonia]|uniref:hypothetical protein n=1 Tax=unclassified Leifsonia TaxID=2663824 RepID=UPI000B7C6CF1|nr:MULTISPECIES: hypothetical protein [unclassified Leifsonia]
MAAALTVALAGCVNNRTGDGTSSKIVASDPPAAQDAPAPTPTPTQPQLSGIIAVMGATTTIGAVTLEVNTIDPSTGTTSSYASFRSVTDGTGPQVSTDLVRTENPTPDVVAAMFSHDFTRVVATTTDPATKLMNAGWIDSNGQFTNVTGSLYQQGQFANVPGYRNPMFGPGDAFYVSQYTGSGMDTGAGKLFVAAPGTTQPTPVNVPQTGDGAPYWYWVSPNGTITPRDPGGYHYEENVTPGVGSIRAESWVDAGTWLGVDQDAAQIWADTTVLPQAQINVMDWGSDGRAVTPQVSGFTVRSPVISPDKQTVAFIAHAADGSHLYTVPLAGGQPQIVNTTTGIDDTTVLAGWR